MASSIQNLFTITILAITTFIILDVNKSDSFDKTITAKYLNHIGAKPYVQKGINTIVHSNVYKQYILPNYNSMVRAAQPYITNIKKEILKHNNQFNIWLKNNVSLLLQYIERKIIPVMAENWSHFVSFSQHYLNVIYSKSEEISLVAGEWISSNVLKKLPRDEIMKAFAEFVSSTQKVAYNSYEYIASQLQKLIA